MLNTTPATFGASEIVPSAKMNAELRDALTNLQSAWTSYSPAWTASGTNPALGNGTMVASYTRIGKYEIKGKILLTMGSSTTYGTGAWIFNLPVLSIGGNNTPSQISTLCFDTSAGARYAVGGYLSSALLLVPTTATPGNVSSTVPFTWASGDVLAIQFSYEPA